MSSDLAGQGSPAEGPLAGIRVLSFGAFVAGNTAAMLLADLGADVVKIESRSRPEVLRSPIYAFTDSVVEPSGALNTVLYAGLSQGTRGLAIDMAQPDGRAMFRRLVEKADVVIENFGATVMARWGCSFDDLLAHNPQLVMLSLSGYGRTGPKRDFLAYGATISDFVGLSALWGYSHGTHTDYIAAVHGTFGVLAALTQAELSGQGVYLDIAQIETSGAVMAPFLLEKLVNGRDAERADNVVPGALFAEVVRCRGHDRWLAVELESLGDWRILCEVLDRPDLVVTEVSTVPERYAELHVMLMAWASDISALTAAHVLQRAGLAAGAVQDSEDVFRDPQLRTRDFMVEVDQPDIGPLEYPGSPYRLSKTPGGLRRPGPRLGQHTIEVLCEWVELDETQIATLLASGAVWQAP